MKHITLGIAFVCVMLFTACDDKQVENDYGRISVNLAGGETVASSNARTMFPSTVFDRYVYTFIKAGETTGLELSPDSNGFFTLEVGSYTLEVQAFIGSAEPYTLAANGVSSQFTVGSGNNAPVEVLLSGVDAGQGVFSYTITYPAGAVAEIVLKKWPELNDIAINPVYVPQGNGKTQTFELNTGSYLLTVLISKDGLYAGKNEAVHIYSALTTYYEKNFNDDDLSATGTPGLAYELITTGTNANTYRVRRGTVTGGAVIIPASYNGLSVTEISGGNNISPSSGAFYGTSITSIIIPDSVTFISAYAFYNCTSLALTELPAGVTAISDYAFYGCKNLALTELPAGVTAIGAYAFYGCTNLALTELPAGVTRISDYVFYGCTSLALTELPAGVRYIGNSSFRGCTSLALMSLPAELGYGNYNDSAIKPYAFYGCTSLVLTSLPEGVLYISDYVFYGCTSLALTELWANIGNYAFYNCTSLPLTELRASNIGNYAFYNCTSLALTELQASNSGARVTSIGDYVFYGCTSLALTTLPAGVTAIGNYAFYGCTSLALTILPAGVTSIGYFAFNGCTSLSSITIPAGVTSLPEGSWVSSGYIGVFANCTSLTTVTFATGSQLGSIGSYAFYGCTSLPSITILASVTSIGDYAFFACTSLNRVTFALGSDITNFGDSAFSQIYSGYNQLRIAYRAGGAGTYTRDSGGDNWTKE